MEIMSYEHNGRGITYLDGKIVFVPNTIIGEDVEIKIIENKKNYMIGEVIKYNLKSDFRNEKICKNFNNCGGCDILHLPYKKQLEYKQNKVKEVIKKFYKHDVLIKDIIFSDNFNYRNKASFKIDKEIGFYRKNTHDVINIKNCDLLSEEINEILMILNKIDLKNNKEIIIRSGYNSVMLILDSEIDISLLKDKVDSIYIKDKKIYGDDYIYDFIGEIKYAIYPKSFFQVNKFKTINLYNKVLEYASLSKKEVVLDLYCGAGTIGLFISKNASKVIGVEINEDAYKSALLNKSINGINNVDFILGDVGKILKNNNYSNIDIVIVDPPRSGLDDLTINGLIKINSKKIIYVSCDVVTLARDLKKLDNLYEVIEITPVDMFPNTYHVETVSLLLRKDK